MRPKKILRNACALFGALVAFQVAGAGGALAAGLVVLKGATVIDVVAEKSIPNAVVIIDGDKVKSVGGQGTAYPAGANVVDLTGKYIIPGLIDGHVHHVPFMGEIFLNYGVTSMLYMGNYVGTPHVDFQYKADSYKADFRAPRIYGMITNLTRDDNMTCAQAKQAVNDWLKVEGGPEYINFANIEDYRTKNKEIWKCKVDALHAAGVANYGHSENTAESIALGQDVVEHIWGISQAMMTPQELENYRRGKYMHWGLFLKENDPRIDALIHEGAKRNDFLNPTLVYSYSSLSSHAAQYQDLMRKQFSNGALMTYFPQNLADGMVNRMQTAWVASRKYADYAPLSALTPEELAQFKEGRRLSDLLVKKWVDAGGRIVAGTDDPYIGSPGLGLHLEMDMLVEAGLTPMQALKSATIWTAEVMTARRKSPSKPPVGYLAPGTYADLVVLSADPMADIDNTRKIEQVMKGGAFVKLGYNSDYSQRPQSDMPAMFLQVVPSNPNPTMSGITPNAVLEDHPAFDMLVEGNGFSVQSIVKVDDITVPTTYVSSRKLIAKIPASVSASGVRFSSPGLDQHLGVFGDHTAKVTVYNHSPDGGTSNPIFFRVQEPWLGEPGEQ